MFVTSYMLSLLGQQRLTLGDRFTERFPHPWLVWEPGRWNAPDDSRVTRQPAAFSRLPGRDPNSLAFALIDKRGRGLWVGRSEHNDIIINDATVSRTHVRLELTDPLCVEVGTTAQPARVRGAVLPPGGKAPLRFGEQLLLGDVALTLLDSQQMSLRLDELRRST